MKPIIWLIVHGRCIRPLFLGMRFCKFKKIAKESVQLKRACQSLNYVWWYWSNLWRKRHGFFAQRAPIDSLVKQIHRLTEVIAEWLPENQHIEELASILSFYFDCLSYLRISEYYDNGFYTSISLRNYDCVVKQFLCRSGLFIVTTIR